MYLLKRFAPLMIALVFAAAFLLVMLNASRSGASAIRPNQASFDAVPTSSAPSISLASALTGGEVITAFALFMPSRPLPPVLALLTLPPALANPYDDGVPLTVKLWRGGGFRLRLTC